jgi:hypothetical protein
MFQKKLVENIKTCGSLTSPHPTPEKRAVYEIKVEKYGIARQATNDKTILRMRVACWIAKAAHTHSEYVILIAFPLQQWTPLRASMLHYTHTGCLGCTEVH